jgi:hypothetical protein
MYGTSIDMEHALLRFGPSTIDLRVEPYGLNALHIAIRRGAWKMVNVRTCQEFASLLCSFLLVCHSLYRNA